MAIFVAKSHRREGDTLRLGRLGIKPYCTAVENGQEGVRAQAAILEVEDVEDDPPSV